MGRLVIPIPSPNTVKDPSARKLFEALIVNMNAWAGKSRTRDGKPDDLMRLPDVQEMIESRIALLNPRGRLASRRQVSAGAGQTIVIAAGGFATSTSKFEQSILGPLTFDATAGMAISSHSLGGTLPINAHITYAWLTCQSTFTSATDAATISLDVQADDPGGIIPAIAISDSSNPWDAGNHLGIPTPTNPDSFTTPTTAARDIQATVAGEALTGGKFTLIIFYEVIP